MKDLLGIISNEKGHGAPSTLAIIVLSPILIPMAIYSMIKSGVKKLASKVKGVK